MIKIEKKNASNAELRQFAGVLIVVLAVIEAWMYWRTGDISPLIAALIIMMLFPAVAMPRLLAPLHSLWMKLGHGLGWVNTHIILLLMYLLILTPVGLLRRALGKRGLKLAGDHSARTYAVLSKQRSPKHFDWLF